MNRITHLALQERLRDLITALPEFTSDSGATVLIEDRAGMAYDIASKLAALEGPLVTIGAGSGTRRSGDKHWLYSVEALTVTLFAQPLMYANRPAPVLPLDLLDTLIAAVHGESISGGNTDLGYAFFAFESWEVSEPTEGTVAYSIHFSAPVVLKANTENN